MTKFMEDRCRAELQEATTQLHGAEWHVSVLREYEVPKDILANAEAAVCFWKRRCEKFHRLLYGHCE